MLMGRALSNDGIAAMIFSVAILNGVPPLSVVKLGGNGLKNRRHWGSESRARPAFAMTAISVSSWMSMVLDVLLRVMLSCV